MQCITHRHRVVGENILYCAYCARMQRNPHPSPQFTTNLPSPIVRIVSYRIVAAVLTHIRHNMYSLCLSLHQNSDWSSPVRCLTLTQLSANKVIRFMSLIKICKTSYCTNFIFKIYCQPRYSPHHLSDTCQCLVPARHF